MYKTKNKFVSMMGIICISSIGSANAGLDIFSSEQMYAPDQAKVGEKEKYSFTQVGVSSERAKVIKGYGKDMPLGLSAEVIVPNTWKIKINDGAENLRVNWRGGVAWPYVLMDMAKKNDLRVLIDWKKRVVDIYSDKAEQLRLEKIAQEKIEAENAAKKLEQEKYKMLQDRKAKYTKMGVVPEELEFKVAKDTKTSDIDEFKVANYILEPNSTLRENIAAWSKAVGWVVKWNSDVDFKITREVRIKGTFFEAVSNIIEYYKNSDRPIKVKFYTKNKVVSVINHDYKIKEN